MRYINRLFTYLLYLLTDLHMAQLVPLPLTVSCSSITQIGYTFLVPAHLGGPGQRAIKRVCIHKQQGSQPEINVQQMT